VRRESYYHTHEASRLTHYIDDRTKTVQHHNNRKLRRNNSFHPSFQLLKLLLSYLHPITYEYTS